MKANKALMIVMGVVLMLGGLIIYISQQPSSHKQGIVDSPSEELIDSPVIEELDDSNEHVVEIKKLIKELGNNQWDKNSYEDIKSKINNKYKSDLLTTKEQEILLKNLTITYIDTLNAAARAFFTNGTKTSKLSPINEELKTYIKTDYHSLVEEMRTASSGFYELRNQERSITKYVNGYEFDEEHLEAYFKELDELKSREYLNRSSIVRSKVQRSKRALIDKLIEVSLLALTSPIENYWSQAAYNEEQTKGYLQQLENLSTNEYLKDSDDIQQFYKEATKQLAKHQRTDNTYKATIPYSSDPCETLFEQFNFYIRACQNIRDTLQSEQN